MVRNLLPSPLTALAALLLLSACAAEEPVKTERRAVAVLKVMPATDGAAASFPGEIRSAYESQLGFQVAGRIVTRAINTGETVKAGQALLRLDPADYARALDSATAQTGAARTVAAAQSADLARASDLLGQGFISRAEFDQAKAATDQAGAQLRAAEAQRGGAAAQLGRTTLTAPRAGIIIQVQGEVGQVVPAGSAVVTIADPARPEIAVALPEGALGAVQNAKRLTVTLLSDPGRTYEARLRTLAGAADPATRTFAARLSILGDAQLRIGETAELHVEGQRAAFALSVPLTAVARGASGAQVWVLDRNTMSVQPRAVSLGAPKGDALTVLTGLEAGETIVTAGVHLLRPGEKVRVVDVPAS
ncbi:efflux RND transporter periplasmic adaptor subunit [Caulobacter sp.]|uniref:efflux RND transporter periplasmic adaptor subunit n=1 Tax=Caulobacter sp. TaxID=78 RepID=UPI0031D78B49